MKNRILLILFLLIPICLVVWFAYRAQSNEQLAAQQQYQNLAHSQLKLIDEKIAHYFQQLETTLIANRAQLELEPSAKIEPSAEIKPSAGIKSAASKIRQFLKYSPYILNIYIADKDQKNIYPSLTQNLSEKEQQFLSNIQVISNDQSLFHVQKEIEGSFEGDSKANNKASKAQKDTVQASSNRVTAISQKLSPKSRSSQFQTKSMPQEHGWIAWYQERNLHHLFWFRDAQQRLYLLYLDRIRILSELIALLPDNTLSSDPYNNSQYKRTIQLSNSNNELIYEWGNYPAHNNKSIDLMLSYPLSSWKLSRYAENLSENSFQQRWALLIIALFASLLMLVLMLIFYREYNREIRQAQQRVNFVGQVSHELKTPLTNIRMYAELLEAKITSQELPDQLPDKTEGQAKAQHFLRVIINESQRLSRLIENVLNFAKVQKETFKVNKTKNIIDACIDNVLLSFAPVFKQKQLSVQFNRNAAKAVFFDSQLLEQILNNLLSNVEKYAAQGRKVDINSYQTENKITIEVRDYGPGIAKMEQEKVFKPFYRSSEKITEGVSGTGIGLTISQQLASLHGGSLSYKNVPAGACFVIQLETETVAVND